MTEPTPRLGRGGRWSAGLDGGLIGAAQPYDVAAARAERPRAIFSWPQTAVVGARPTMDVGDMPEPPCPDCGTAPCELAATAEGLRISLSEVHALYARIEAVNAAPEVVEPPADPWGPQPPCTACGATTPCGLHCLEPAPPSRRGWLARAIRRIR